MGDIHFAGGNLKDVHIPGETCQAIWYRGQKVWERQTLIEDFEGSTNVGDHLRGTDTGNASISGAAALATGRGSTQGLRFSGFNERYAMPGDHDPALESGKVARFYFRPRNFGSNQFHFLLSPQSSAASPPDRCYRLEFHMAGGTRLAIMDGGRNVVDTENITNWSNQQYICTFYADNNGVEFTTAGQTLSTSDTRFVDPVMGFGWRASSGGDVDYDWLGYYDL